MTLVNEKVYGVKQEQEHIYPTSLLLVSGLELDRKCSFLGPPGLMGLCHMFMVVTSVELLHLNSFQLEPVRMLL